MRGAQGILSAPSVAEEALTFLGSLERRDDIRQRDISGFFPEPETARPPAGRLEDAIAGEIAEDLRQIVARRVHRVGDLVHTCRTGMVASDVQNGTERVLDGLRKHDANSISRCEIRRSGRKPDFVAALP